ncbi:hypothetical protein [Sporosarcina luteola]|uniref:hypothetical protein n=1 Tax=Sporosarcina luteola TaxID=582850 RepID=UPI00203F0778|nr:hypothetical protein [Sporosarcina luteola]MCM3709230.1 hypothetical protein [Sporosarcina luteola]
MNARGSSIINYGPANGARTIDGDVTITGNASDKINLRNLTIKGDLIVNTPQATVNNEATVEGIINIQDVATGTWNEKTGNNKIVVNDSTGITLNIASGINVKSLTLHEATKLTVGEGVTFTNPIEINKDSIIISKVSVPAVIGNSIKVTVKANEDDAGTIITGKYSEHPVDLVMEAAVKAAVEAINKLPSLKDIRITHKGAVLNAKALLENAKRLNPTVKVQGEESIAKLLEKIEYLENEAADKKFFPTIYTQSPESQVIFNDTKVLFEGYVTNVKYLEKILINNKEAEVEFIENANVNTSSGVYTGPAFKFNMSLELEDKAHAISIAVESQSGKSGSIARRFYVDTTAPELELTVGGLSENIEISEDEIDVEIRMKDNFGQLYLYRSVSESAIRDNHVFLYEGHISTPSTKTTTDTVYLEMGTNTFYYNLFDAAGNVVKEEITITRVESVVETAIKAAQDAIDEIEGLDVYSSEFKNAVTNANEKLKVARALNATDKQIGAARVAKLDAANSLIKALDAIQSKIKSIVNEDSATALTEAVKNADLGKIQQLQTALNEVKDNTIPETWIKQMLADAGDDIVDFFTTGLASNRETVVNSIGNQVSGEDKAVILGVYDALKAALSPAK